jgi:hypothetical protein
MAEIDRRWPAGAKVSPKVNFGRDRPNFRLQTPTRYSFKFKVDQWVG